jgi:hypothetical protein
MQFGSEIDKADGAVMVVPNVARLSKENSKDTGIMTAATTRVMDKDRF